MGGRSNEYIGNKSIMIRKGGLRATLVIVLVLQNQYKVPLYSVHMGYVDIF